MRFEGTGNGKWEWEMGNGNGEWEMGNGNGDWRIMMDYDCRQ